MLRRLSITGCVLLALAMAQVGRAQEAAHDSDGSRRYVVALRTNMLYDVALIPNVGV